MSVVTLDQKTMKTKLYCKGAPEIIKKLCLKETIPNEFEEVLKDFS